jgi:hypothetical protein
VPQDLTLLSDQDLSELETKAVAEFDRIQGDENVTPDGVQYQLNLTNDIDRIRSEVSVRAARAAANAEQERVRLNQQRESLATRVHGPKDSEGNPIPEKLDTPVIDTEAIARASAEGAVAALVAAMGERGKFDANAISQRANTSLSAARRHAPVVPVSTPRLAVTAGVDIPGVARGANMTSLDELVSAFQRAAKSATITRDGVGQERLVATINNSFEHTVDDRTSAAQMEELLHYLRRPEKMDSLVAGGGWCAPSEIRYEFFNVACSDGLVDLPTVGVSRGGLRVPVSPSIADAFLNGAGTTVGMPGFAKSGFDYTSDPWLWTETSDISAVTGTPTKPTMRVPCPTFTDNRLECYGLTLTAGNLTDDAYPEATQNTLKLLLSAFEHAQNARIISQMVSLSGTAITGAAGGFPAGLTGTFHAAYNQIVSGIDLGATDYRAKYGMCDADVLEVVAPYWLKDVITADLAWRTAVELLSVTDAQINGYFADRNLRVQWVNDWQVRGSGQFGNATTPMSNWPTSAQVMIFAAGTFIKGNGLTLDLGVVRDSVLNAANDFTAAWSEECHLVAKVGHESRLYTITFAVNGAGSLGTALGNNL